MNMKIKENIQWLINFRSSTESVGYQRLKSKTIM